MDLAQFISSTVTYYRMDLTDDADALRVENIRKQCASYSANWQKVFDRLIAAHKFKPQVADLLPIISECIDHTSPAKPVAWCKECANLRRVNYHVPTCPTLRGVTLRDMHDLRLPTRDDGKRPGVCHECAMAVKMCKACQG